MTADQLTELRTLATTSPAIAAAVELIDSLPKYHDGSPMTLLNDAWYFIPHGTLPLQVTMSAGNIDAYRGIQIYRTLAEARAAMEAAR